MRLLGALVSMCLRKRMRCVFWSCVCVGARDVRTAHGKSVAAGLLVCCRSVPECVPCHVLILTVRCFVVVQPPFPTPVAACRQMLKVFCHVVRGLFGYGCVEVAGTSSFAGKCLGSMRLWCCGARTLLGFLGRVPPAFCCRTWNATCIAHRSCLNVLFRYSLNPLRRGAYASSSDEFSATDR